MGHGVEEKSKTIPATERTPARTIRIREPYVYDVMSFDSEFNLIKNFATRTNIKTKPELIEILDSRYLMFSAGSDPKVDFGLSKTFVKRTKDASGNEKKVVRYIKKEGRKDSAPIIIKLEPRLPSMNFDKSNLYNINDELRYFVNPSGEIVVVGLKGNNTSVVQNTDKWPVHIYMMKVRF